MAKRHNRQQAVERLRGDLQQALGPRLHSLVVYGTERADGTLHSLAVVEDFTPEDLLRLAPAAAGWESIGVAVPLVFDRSELARSLDAFPLEFSRIIARHEVVAGEEPLAGMRVKVEDLRRACEAQARSHLVHLREGYLQAGAAPGEVAAMVADSLAPLRALLSDVARLAGADAGTEAEMSAFVEQRVAAAAPGLRPLLALDPAARPSPSEAERLFPGYLQGVERLVAFLDGFGR